MRAPCFLVVTQLGATVSEHRTLDEAKAAASGESQVDIVGVSLYRHPTLGLLPGYTRLQGGCGTPLPRGDERLQNSAQETCFSR